jgi:hypothetical protein
MLAENFGGAGTLLKLARLGFGQLRSKGLIAARIFVVIGAALFAAPSSAIAIDDTSASQDCFDAEVYATVTQEIPSEIPDLGDGSIVMEWPWFLDLQIERVLYGGIGRGTLSVLAIQHTYFSPRYQLWWLRRNSTGGFNVVSRDDRNKLGRCPKGAAPVAPYIRPGEGKTLDDLRQAGERRFGRFP